MSSATIRVNACSKLNISIDSVPSPEMDLGRALSSFRSERKDDAGIKGAQSVDASCEVQCRRHLCRSRVCKACAKLPTRRWSRQGGLTPLLGMLHPTNAQVAAQGFDLPVSLNRSDSLNRFEHIAFRTFSERTAVALPEAMMSNPRHQGAHVHHHSAHLYLSRCRLLRSMNNSEPCKCNRFFSDELAQQERQHSSCKGSMMVLRSYQNINAVRGWRL